MRRGFSFVEVAIGTLILALALIPTLGLLMRNTQGIRVTADELEAVNLAGGLLESVQALPLEQIPDLGPPPGTRYQDLAPDVQARLAVPLPSSDRFKVFLSVEPASVPAPAGVPSSPVLDEARRLKVVTVTCTWMTSGLGDRSALDKPRSLRLATVVSRAVQR